MAPPTPELGLQIEPSCSPKKVSSSSKLPNEILDIIFGDLSFIDLVRCNAAFKQWSQALQSCSLLRSRLFLSSQGSASRSKRRILKIDISIFAIDDLEGYYMRWNSFVNVNGFPDGPDYRWTEDETEFHPILSDLRRFMHIVHPSFKRDCVQVSHLLFHNLQDLKEQTVRCNDRGSWADMYVTKSPLERLEVEFKWYHYHNCPWSVSWDTQPIIVGRREGSEGVRVLDFVEMCRKELENLHRHLREEYWVEGTGRLQWVSRWARG